MRGEPRPDRAKPVASAIIPLSVAVLTQGGNKAQAITETSWNGAIAAAQECFKRNRVSLICWKRDEMADAQTSFCFSLGAEFKTPAR
jgi:hypothetical protein